MSKKEAAETPVEGMDTAAVNEPTKHAVAVEGEREAPAYVIATQELIAHGVRAHMPGDRVPTVNVERFNWAQGVRPE